MQKIAVFRFEASAKMGAGHAMRCSVLLKALSVQGWQCLIVTLRDTINFIPDLERFTYLDPDEFYKNPVHCELLIIDHYDLNFTYESYFRSFANKILVIDDLANRKHDCDVLVDQTYGRAEKDYKDLVPINCKVLTGGAYALLRTEFAKLRPKALKKRQLTDKVNRILISMGGSDPKNNTLKALELIKKSHFTGAIDIVLGFQNPFIESVEKFVSTLPNPCKIYHNTMMANLIYEADFAIGGAGSSVWERDCLGLPSVLIVTADNQKFIYESLSQRHLVVSSEQFLAYSDDLIRFKKCLIGTIDGFGVNRVLFQTLYSDQFQDINLKTIELNDKKMIWGWQQLVRQYSINTSLPTWEEHTFWFENRLKQNANPYWMVTYKGIPVGVLSFEYQEITEDFLLSWYVIPDYQGKGLGTKVIKLAAKLCWPINIQAFVKEENIASQKALLKAGFKAIALCQYIFEQPERVPEL